MNRSATALAIAAWSTLVFAGGYVFREYQLLHSSTVETTQPLALVSANGKPDGVLPVGTTLYGFRSSGDQSLFIAFIGTKEISQMREQNSKHWFEVSPLTALKRKQ